MSRWRRVALEKLPELRREIERAWSPYALWIETLLRFERTYEQDPIDDDFIRRVYEYAWWCLRDSRYDELVTATIVTFFEHLPLHKQVREDLPRWMSPLEFYDMKEVFRYFLTDREHAEFVDEFCGWSNRWTSENKPLDLPKG